MSSATKTARAILKWFDQYGRPLPFRSNRTPYRTLVCEVMAQQTTMSVVLDYYKRWMRRFPSVKALAQADLAEVLKTWEGLGYYQRARNLHRIARHITEERRGRWPRTFEEWRRLPGVGDYTAAALSSLLHGEPVAAVDGNVRRVAARMMGWEGPLDRRFDREQVIPWMERLFRYGPSGRINEAVMELGSTVCLPRRPLCRTCPIQYDCRCAHQSELIEKIPMKRRQSCRDLHVVVAIIMHRNRFFFQQRRKGKLFEGLWELPGGKIETGETPQTAMIRELKEELGVTVKPADLRLLFTIPHTYTNFRVRFKVFAVDVKMRLKQRIDRKYLSINQFKDYPMPAGTVKILNKVLENKLIGLY